MRRRRRKSQPGAIRSRTLRGARVGGLAWYVVGAPTPATAFAVPKDFL